MTTQREAGREPVSSGPSGYRMFTAAQLDEIHLASLEILRRTGVRVYEAEALAMLRDAGCIVSDDDASTGSAQALVRFPAAVVEDALDAVPSRIVLCDRTGEPRMYLEGQRTYFGTGSDLPNTRDLETGERRQSL